MASWDRSAYDSGSDAGSSEGRDNPRQDHPAASRDQDFVTRQRQDNAAIEARLDEAGLPTRAESRAAAMRPDTDDEDDFALTPEEAAAIEARLPEAGLPTRAESRAAAMRPDTDDEDDQDHFSPESNAAIEARLDEAGLPTRAESRAAARRPYATGNYNKDDPASGYEDAAEPIPAHGNTTPARQDSASAADVGTEQTPSLKQQQISALEADVGQKFADLQAKNDALQAENADLRQNAADANQKITNLNQTVADLKQQAVEAGQRIAAGDQKIADLELRVADGDQKVADANQKIAALTTNYAELAARMDRNDELLARPGKPPDAATPEGGEGRPRASPDQREARDPASVKRDEEMAAHEGVRASETKEARSYGWRHAASAENFGIVSAVLSVADTVQQFAAHAPPTMFGVGAVATSLVSVGLGKSEQKRKERRKT